MRSFSPDPNARPERGRAPVDVGTALMCAGVGLAGMALFDLATYWIFLLSLDNR